MITQTTLSVDDTRAIIDALKTRFPKLIVPAKDDICYATQNRQNAVKAIAAEAEVLLVIGAANSSNSIRLTEVAEDAGRRAYLINDASEIDPAWFEGVTCVGVTSGASAPEHLVQEVVEALPLPAPIGGKRAQAEGTAALRQRAKERGVDGGDGKPRDKSET